MIANQPRFDDINSDNLPESTLGSTEASTSGSADNSPSSDKTIADKVKIDFQPAKKSSISAELFQIWEFAAVAQFFHIFYAQLGLESFDTRDLIEFFETKQGFIYELQVRIFRTGTRNRFIEQDNWLEYIEKDVESPKGNLKVYVKDLAYEQISLVDRVRILLYICELQLDRPETLKTDRFSEPQAATWRVDSIGKDSDGYEYWLFDDGRLYKERKREWTLCCESESQWTNFVESFKNSERKLDKELYRYLNKSVLPVVVMDIQLINFQYQEVLEQRRQVEELKLQELEEARKQQELQELLKQNELIINQSTGLDDVDEIISYRGVRTRSGLRTVKSKPYIAVVKKTAQELRLERMEKRRHVIETAFGIKPERKRKKKDKNDTSEEENAQYTSDEENDSVDYERDSRDSSPENEANS